MKKSFLLLACLLLTFASCSDDDDRVSEVVLNAKSIGTNNSYQITDAETGAAYYSENACIASVSDKGLVSAMFCGETNIVITEKNSIRKLKVTVKPVLDFAMIPSFKVLNCTAATMASFLKSIGGGTFTEKTIEETDTKAEAGGTTILTYKMTSSASKVSHYTSTISNQIFNRAIISGDTRVTYKIYLNKKLVSETELKQFVQERFELSDVPQADAVFSRVSTGVYMSGTNLLGDSVVVNETTEDGNSYYVITIGYFPIYID